MINGAAAGADADAGDVVFYHIAKITMTVIMIISMIVRMIIIMTTVASMPVLCLS